MAKFWTLEREFQSELEDRKSRFLAFVLPYSAFEQRLAELRREHRKANHHVTAFRYWGSEDRVKEGAKDDGEPAGTSGMPILKALIGRELIDIGVIVVRYFGGTKLGTGGLARAYSGAAIRAIEAAELVPWQKVITRVIRCRFDESAGIEATIAKRQLNVQEREYTETGVIFTISGPEAAMTDFSDSL